MSDVTSTVREGQTMAQTIQTRTGVPFEAGASFPGRRAQRITPSSREIKLLRPICDICEKAAGGGRYLEPLWFESCPHDPYVSMAPVNTEHPVYEPVDPENPSGAQRIIRVDKHIEFLPRPNWVSTGIGGGINKGRGIHRSLWKGFIYPQQLKSPLFPDGIKMRCMFRDCYSEDIKKFQSGWFCREYEAKMVMLSDMEETWEVGEFSPKNDAIRKKILDSVNVA